MTTRMPRTGAGNGLARLLAVAVAAFSFWAVPLPALTETGSRVELPTAATGDIRDFIRWYAETTGTTVTIDPQVAGDIRVVAPDGLQRSQLTPVFMAVLDVNGFSATASGGTLHILPLAKGMATADLARPRSGGGQTALALETRILPVPAPQTDLLGAALRALLSPAGQLVVSRPAAVIVVRDSSDNLDRLVGLARHLAKEGSRRTIRVLSLERADAAVAADTLRRSLSAGPLADDQTVIEPDPRTNQLVVHAAEPQHAVIREMATLLDAPAQAAEESIHVRFLNHASAAEVADILGRSFLPGPAEGTAASRDAPAPAGGILAEPDTNAIIFRAAPDQKTRLMRVIDQLDRFRPMVLLEAAILEQDSGGDVIVRFEGAGFWGQEKEPDGFLGGWGGLFSESRPLTSPPDLPDGMAVGVVRDPIRFASSNGQAAEVPELAALVKTLENRGGTQLLARPKLLVLDQQEASLSLVSNVPYLTASETSELVQNVINTYEYLDIGLTLKLAAQVLGPNRAAVEVDLELTDLGRTDTAESLRPTTRVRRLNTRVSLAGDQTVVIGAFRHHTLAQNKRSIPVLGDIPVVNFFLTPERAKGAEHTRLFVFLRARPIVNATAKTDGEGAGGGG
jgi:general secretion pathway protein D